MNMPRKDAVDESMTFPLSASQAGRWYEYQLLPEQRGEHNSAFAAVIHGASAPTIAHAMGELCRRHPMLRARFGDRVGIPMQWIEPPGSCTITEVPVEDLDDEALVRRVDDDARLPVAGNDTPPLRVSLYRRKAGRGDVLLVVFDHLVVDGWSYWRLLGEFVEYLGGHHSDVTLADDASYRDFVEEQSTWLESPAAEKSLSFWADVLGGNRSILSLPRGLDARDSRPQTLRPSLSVTIDQTTLKAIQDLSRANASSLFTCLLAAFASTLHRFSDQDDLVVGCPVPARGDGRWDATIGDMVNVVPVRSRFSGDETVRDVLRATRNMAHRCLARQELPLSVMVERLCLSGPADTSPVFQAMFTLQRARNDGGISNLFAGRPLTVGQGDAAISMSPFPLRPGFPGMGVDVFLQAIEFDDGMRCEFAMNGERFAREDAARLSEGFITVLEAMVAAPDMPVGRLPLMNAASRARVVDTFNATARAYPEGDLVHTLFERSAAAHPDAVAIESDAGSWTYGELNRRANRLAHTLIARGLVPDDRVAICLERGPSMVLALLATLKAGAAYVPLDPGYPAERLHYMLGDCRPALLLTDTVRADTLVATVPTMLLDGEPALSPDTTDPSPDALGLTDRHLAYIIYTSGSTGRPKGVMNQHDGVVNRLRWAQEQFTLDNTDRVLQKTPFGFDVSVWEFFLPLLAGARLVLARPGGHQDPAYLADLIHRGQVTIVHFVPSMLRVFLDQAGDIDTRALRHLLCSGEALPAPLAARCLDRLPDVALHNLYGPTEAAVDVTWWQCLPDARIVPIGRPIANTRLYILDRHLQPVPIGVAGELHIGGVQVARGYFDRPELTAERFIVDPFVVDGGRLYKTGDLARWREDGAIEYLGRNDFQVKLRGFRIELGEIESVLLAQPGVREAVVVAGDDVHGDPRLIAYLVCDGALSPDDLRQALGRALPLYMVPAAFVTLDALPLSSNGKLDRRSLPAADVTAVPERPYEAPKGPLEQAIATLWMELLGLDRVSRRDRFFDIGGHSLLMTRMAFALKERLGTSLSMAELYELQTVASIGEVIAQRQPAYDEPTITIEF
jgi:amino acid adenylation domain-containing protein